ncbi:MAG: amino acid adenylation domain-containing protein [Spirochaetales bacterium]|nr:amino acid adenylation domain-containing protein [Spirochaetales bacterium]
MSTTSHSFIRLFEEISENNDNIAIITQNGEFNYSELNELSNKYSNYFLSKGISSGDMVGICLERNEFLLPSILGLLKIGASYIPLDPNFPVSRLQYMVEDSGLRTIISQKNLIRIFQIKDNLELLTLDSAASKIKKQDKKNPEIVITGDDLAYMIYTSGSTGNPKGVQIQHKALLNFLVSMSKEPGITHEDRLLALTTLSFDISGLELYLPLISGATVVLATSEQSKNPLSLIEIINKNKVTMMQATPASYSMLRDAEWVNNSVKKILCGGEALSQDLASYLFDQAQEVWNMYGPTETTIWSTIYRITSKDEKPLIGKPIDNTSVYILNESLNPVSDGEEGDLYIGGDGLSLGYFNRPELTSQRFIEYVRADGSSERIYKTGDVCSLNEEGILEYMGRSDFQVKIRGFRIELGEIEAALVKEPSVRNAVVVAKEGAFGNKQLVAYVVVVNNKDFKEQRIRKSLSNFLPTYMVPNVFVVVDEFPLTPNDKIDRKKLTSMKTQVDSDNSQNVEFSSPQEERIATIFRNALDIPIDNMDGSFLDYGGDSITSMRVLYKLQKEFSNVPTDWAQMTISFLAKRSEKSSENKNWRSYFKFSPLSPDIILRAVAIISVVASHIGWKGFIVKGDIHVFLLLVGYNFGKFQLSNILMTGDVRRLRNYIGKIIIISFPLLVLLYLYNNPRHISTILYYANLFDYSLDQTGKNIAMWFIACYIQILLILWGFLSINKIREVWYNRTFLITLIFVSITFAARFILPVMLNPEYLTTGIPFLSIWTYHPATHLSTVFLGILIAVAKNNKEIGIVFICSLFFSIVLAYSNTIDGVWAVFFSVTLLLFFEKLLFLPYFLSRIITSISSASLYIYLTHWLIYVSLLHIGLSFTLPLFTIIVTIGGTVLYSIWEELELKFRDFVNKK